LPLKVSPNLLAPGASEVLRRLRLEGGVRIFFCCHGDGCFDVRQTASCSSSQYRCDFLPDDALLFALEPRMVCTACGLIGADVRPDWSPHPGVNLKKSARGVPPWLGFGPMG
jgi:hypothetical protein